MDFDLKPEEAEIRDLIRQVGHEKFRPMAFERRHAFEPPEENMKLLAELGILGMCLPQEYGGAGRSDFEAVVAMEEPARACPVTAAYAILTLTGPASVIAKLGSEEQKQRYLPSVCDGSKRFAISMTEPGAGSAVTDMTTKAEIRGDSCVINGQKIFCSGAPHSHYFLTYVRFGPGVGGIGAVMVNRDTPGFEMSVPHRHISNETWCELFFDDATIPVEDVVTTGDAFRRLMAGFSYERCGAAAFALGVAQISMELALAYVEDRRQFGRRLGDFQLVQAKLADMYIALESARLLVYRAMVQGKDGFPNRLDSSAAKVAATDAASFVTDEAMQMHGGSGMSQELPLEWLHRVVRCYEVAGGTSDVLRIGMAGELLGRRIDQRPPRPTAGATA